MYVCVCICEVRTERLVRKCLKIVRLDKKNEETGKKFFNKERKRISLPRLPS